MLYKIYNSDGDWQVKATGERCILHELDAPETEESKQFGYSEFTSIQEAAKAWGLTPWIKTQD